MSKIRHILGISGGKDSAALAIYLREKYPQLDITYYFCDTGKELDATYHLIEKLKGVLGKDIVELGSDEANEANENPFDFHYRAFRGYLPSAQIRWCTKYLKLYPFEKYVGEDPVVSYVGIRGDEFREGYISKKSNIQSIFPFRKNIWSEDVIKKLLADENREVVGDLYSYWIKGQELDGVVEILKNPLKLAKQQTSYNEKQINNKLNSLLNKGVSTFNHVVFDWLKETAYPLAQEGDFPLLENEDVLIKDDIFKILEESGVGIPEYYQNMVYEVDGKRGEYARSRSGCFFCFFQQKIEWVWLYEQHPDLFEKAMFYENEDEGFTWNHSESLKDIIDPRRIEQIKREHLNRSNRESSKKSSFLLDILDDPEQDQCTACFI